MRMLRDPDRRGRSNTAMRNKNMWIILGAVAVIALVAVLAVTLQPSPAVPDTDAPAVTLEGDAADAPGGQEARAYLLMTVGGTTYAPLALTTEGDFTIRQEATGAENVVHVTPDSIAMKSANCDNQDCVLQGTVTLDTKDDRVLGSMIICLPHQVTLELYSAEEMAALLADMERESEAQ